MSLPGRSRRVPLRVTVLGPLRVVDASGADITPAGVLQRRLLALLVLRRGTVVTPDTAIDTLWPADPPSDATAALQNHMFRLRRALPDGAIESVDTGYRLDAAAVDVDADGLAALTADDLATPEARRALQATLDRWRGPAYPELAEADVAVAHLARFDDLRFTATESLAEARLRAGATEGLAVTLTELVERDPLRERPRALLMDVLAAGGRTADALRVYDDFRRTLGDELGIEPSPWLQARHGELLRGALPADDPAPQSPLPVPTTSLVGRADLLDELVATCRDERAVTLVGPGGVGKTRLLIEIGHRLRSVRPDHQVVLCELAPAGATTAVDVVAGALAIDARPGVSSTTRVVELLRDVDVTLLLDNAEHVLEPVADLVDRLVRSCPGVSVVVTSRERLRVPGEQVRVVPTLLAGGGSATELFVERARAVRPELSPDDAELALITEIVQRLDGLPLAIELAAARLHSLDVGEVAAGLGRPLSLLASGYRTSTRHGSLHAVVAWSYSLLDADLQAHFDALSVFGRSFTVADAAAVTDLGVDAAAEVLAQLVERSLLVRTPDRRFAMLETLRAFAAECLEASGCADDVRQRHACWLVDWAERSEEALLTEGSAFVTEIDDAVPELRSATDWLLAHGRVAEAGRLVAGLQVYSVMRLRADVLAWAEDVLDAADGGAGLDDPLAARMWAVAGYGAWMTGDVDGCGERGVRAVEIAERSGGLVPVVATVRGNVDLFQGRLADAAVWYRRAVDSATEGTAARFMATGALALALGYAGDPEAVDLADRIVHEVGNVATPIAAYTWYCAGEAEMAFDLDRARARIDRAVELAEASNASFVLGVAGASRASIEARSGDPQVAAGEYRWLIAHWRRASVWSLQWTMLRSIATLLARLGRFRDAAILQGAIQATDEGHRIFGADEVALAALSARLRDELGDRDFEEALAEGAQLDGDAAAEHALRAL